MNRHHFTSRALSTRGSMHHVLLALALDAYHPDAERRAGQQGGLQQQHIGAPPEDGQRHGVGAGHAAQAAAHHHQVQRHGTAGLGSWEHTAASTHRPHDNTTQGGNAIPGNPGDIRNRKRETGNSALIEISFFFETGNSLFLFSGINENPDFQYCL